MPKRELGLEIMSRVDRLATISQNPHELTRAYLTREYARAADLVLEWMQDAGMEVRLDAVGNALGRLEGSRPALPSLVLGSHLDTVKDAGRFDGALGLVTAISCVKALHRSGKARPFAIEVYGFGDEEGYRFDSALIGSSAVAGDLEAATLERTDAAGETVEAALRAFGLDPRSVGTAARHRQDVLAYVEVHIEQGPVLEAGGRAVGVVTAIAGATRLEAKIVGEAGHAGTVPMGLRADALTAAAEAITAIESRCSAEPGLVGTVGRISVSPAAVNVIPGLASFSIDIRAAGDASRRSAVLEVSRALEEICGRRGVRVELDTTHECDAVDCAPWLVRQLEEAVVAEGVSVCRLPSGAGHDAMAMAALTDVAMLFVRCKDGLSHHPDEFVDVEDVDTAARVLLRLLRQFKAK